MKIAFICPRYLTNHPGGAEKLCKELAFKSSAEGNDVEIFSTTAKDHFSWENVYPEKTFQENKVTIRLFKVSERNNLNQFYAIQKKMECGEELSYQEENIWLENSVNSDSLYDFLKKNKDKYDAFIFIPYLFGLTINGTKICPEKSYLIPCLHNESFAYLKCVKEMFLRVKKILFNAPPEMELAKNLYDLNYSKCNFVSLGFEINYTPNPTEFKMKHGITLPYITFAGRRELGKNFMLLLEMVRLFQKMHPKKLAFVSMGAPSIELYNFDKDKIYDVGFLSENEKYDCFAGALFNCQPSVNESLSITVMESWLMNAPVLVNKECSVTSFWVNKSNGGMLFSDFFDFEQSVLFALENAEQLKEMAENGKFFVKENFSWNVILKRFNDALTN